MSDPRRPKAFTPQSRTQEKEPEEQPRIRPPRALREAELEQIVPGDDDVFDAPNVTDAPPPVPERRKRRLTAGGLFLSSAGLLVSFAFGLWLESLIRALFARADWLGWAASDLAAVAVLALAVVLFREMRALSRLAMVEDLRAESTEALRERSLEKSRRLVERLSGFVAADPATAAGRRAMADLKDDVMDGPDLLALAETELLGPIDERARRLILEAAKRVSLVTAVSPRALVDVAYILYESGKLVRRLAELYGARPGKLGYVRLVRSVMAHLAVTGAMAVGDEFVHQVVGQGLAARLSAKLGEGVVNGVMTVRVGLATMDVVRPLPFRAVRKPRLTDFAASLATFASRRTGDRDGAAQ